MKRTTRGLAVAFILLCVALVSARREPLERRADLQDEARFEATDEVLSRATQIMRSILADPRALGELSRSFQVEEPYLHPRFGVAADYAAWRDYRVAYEASVDDHYRFERLGLERRAGEDPPNAARLVDGWARRIETAESVSELAATALEAADIPVPEFAALGDFESAVEALDAAAFAAHDILDREALGALDDDVRGLLPFLVRYTTTTGGTYSANSLEAPPHNWFLYDAHRGFAPGDPQTPLGLDVPEAVPSVTSIYHFYRSLAGYDLETSGVSGDEREWTGSHTTFTGLRVDLAATARALAALAPILEEGFLAELERDCVETESPARVPGVEGDVLVQRTTEYGDLIIGGLGPNRYFEVQAAVIVDLGGDDVYDVDYDLDRLGRYPLRVVIDLHGNDIYSHTEPVGPGAGVFGLGLLLDQEGNDIYAQGVDAARGGDRAALLKDAPTKSQEAGPDMHVVDPERVYGGAEPANLDGGFSYGAALFGIGIHIDRAGHDTYLVDKWALGAAHGPGLALLTDEEGDDWYVAAIQGIGIGFNKGVGIIRDRGAGDDRYQCWGVYRNSYNREGAPDYGFQGYGIGIGFSWRSDRYSQQPTHGPGFVGGIGLVDDSGGNDTYVGGTFGMGVGFTAGIGMMVESAGDDVYLCVKGDAEQHCGMAGGVHHGTGMVLDRAGDDFYASSTATGGGWDLGIGYFIDVAGSDTYTDLFELGHRPAVSQVQTFSVFLDGGDADTFSETSTRWGNAAYFQPNVHQGIGGNFAFALLLGPETNRLPTAMQENLRPGVWLAPVSSGAEEDGTRYPRGIGVVIVESVGSGTK
jgi:hypothetical protein